MAIAACAVVATFFALNRWVSFFSGRQDGSWEACIFGNNVCSAAVGTWALVFVTLLAFLAAFQAVYWAWKTYSIEVEPRLGQSTCPMYHPVNHPSHKEIYLNVGGIVSFRQPLDFVTDDFYSYHQAFKNLGRTALADVRVTLVLVDHDNDKVRSQPIEISIGNVTCHEEIHIALYTTRLLNKVRLKWGDIATQAKPNSLEKEREPIAFYPEDTSKDGNTFPFP